MQNPRIKAASILQSIMEDKIFFGELKRQIPEKDLPFVNMLLLTTLRNWKALNQILQSYLNKKIPHKHRMAQYLLTLAMAEVLYMKTATHAVINETVKNIKQTTDRFLGGMANAVLRKMAANKTEILSQMQKISPLPETFKEILTGYSNTEIEKLASAIVKQPPLDITVKKNPQEWAKKLDAKLLPNGSLRIYDPQRIQQIPGYDAGEWWVQDVAAGLAVQAMGDMSNKKVADLCAAPGGKTAQLAAQGAEVWALDISENRLNTLKQNMQRLGLNNVNTLVADAAIFLQTTTEQFDAVLLDAPCSATGTFRRHPEVLYIKSKEDVLAQLTAQRKLLSGIKNILKIGGTLLYSVCSIAKDEGEKQIADFLADNPGFVLDKIKSADISRYGRWADDFIAPQGYIRTLPCGEDEKNEMDAFFICKMKRII